MSEHDDELSDYLVISRGQWDKDARPEDVQTAIDEFYGWIEGKVSAGRARHGSRLGRDGATVSRKAVVTDGPYGEAKEVVGGFWILRARDLTEAAAMAAENPCMKHGLFYEVRSLDAERCSAFNITNETPSR